MNKSNNFGTLFAASAAILFAIGGLVTAIANPPHPPSPPSPPSSPSSHSPSSAPATQKAQPTTAPKSPAFTIIANAPAAGTKAKSGSQKPGPAPAPAEDTHKPSSPSKAKSAPHDPVAADSASSPSPSQAQSTPSNADEALALLIDGNSRWVDGQVISPNTQAQRREDLAANGQNPFVTIVTCSDSRIPVERVFDRGIGDLFVIRVAGNRAASSEVGTVEYGVEHLKTPLLVVMGHSKCGAVAAAVSGAHLHGKVAELVAGIQPAVDRARKSNPGADEATLVSASIRENVWQTIFDLYKTSPELRALAANGTLKVVGANYDISSGKVEFLGEHPWQSELFAAMNTSQTAAHASAQTPDSTKHTPVHGKDSTAPEHEPAHAAAPTDDHK